MNTSSAHHTPSSGRYIVLVIDDAPETLGMVSAALETEGMTVLVARSGEEGIALAQRVRPDVILLDAMMPEMDGIELLHNLRKLEAFKDTPTLFMTARVRFPAVRA